LGKYENMKSNKEIIGLIGGMGPFASARFLQMLLEKSSKDFGAKNGDDFPEIVLDSVPVPDFISDTKRLSEAKTMLISRIKRLNNFGCTTIAMVCNTGHILFPELSRVSNVEMISLINTVRDAVIKSDFKRVGLLATKTTIKSNLYTNAFTGTSTKIINPNSKTIEICEKAIRGVIANNNSNKEIEKMTRISKEFVEKQNLDGIILGCTELPLAFPKNKLPNIFDCLDILSNRLLENHFGRVS
jgi:aspartate racemase